MSDVHDFGNDPFLDPSEDDSVFDLWGMLWRRKWIVLTACSVGLVLGFLYFYSAQPYYESVAQVLIERKQPTLPTGERFVAVDRYQSLGDALKHPIILKSPVIAQIGLRRTSP